MITQNIYEERSTNSDSQYDQMLYSNIMDQDNSPYGQGEKIMNNQCPDTETEEDMKVEEFINTDQNCKQNLGTLNLSIINHTANNNSYINHTVNNNSFINIQENTQQIIVNSPTNKNTSQLINLPSQIYDQNPIKYEQMEEYNFSLSVDFSEQLSSISSSLKILDQQQNPQFDLEPTENKNKAINNEIQYKSPDQLFKKGKQQIKQEENIEYQSSSAQSQNPDNQKIKSIYKQFQMHKDTSQSENFSENEYLNSLNQSSNKIQKRKFNFPRKGNTAYNKYSQKEKAEVVQLHQQGESIKELSKRFGIPGKNIRRWTLQGIERKSGGGRTCVDPEMEQYLANFIFDYVSQNQQPAPRKIVIETALKQSSNSSFKASKGWHDKFLKRFQIRDKTQQILYSIMQEKSNSQFKEHKLEPIKIEE